MNLIKYLNKNNLSDFKLFFSNICFLLLSYGRIHLQYHLSRGGDGAEVIYSLRNNDTLAKKIGTEFTRVGQNFRKYYQKRLPSNPTKDYYYILRETPNNESIIVEYGFADSKGDDVSQLKNNWQNLAEAVVKAVADYINIPYQDETTENYYRVKNGDTLWSIARRYGVNVSQLISANNLNGYTLSVGQLLYIPINEVETIENKIYTVVNGDTLYSISKKFNLSVDELKSLNNLSSNSLTVGQKLNIKKDSPKVEGEYTVKKGDTLYSIANSFGVNVNSLIDLNNLKSTNLSIGQNLKIPTNNSSSISNIIYTVKKGDTLYKLANTYNTTVSNIKKINNLNSDTLSIGETLIIPS